ncbi:hypothetical protein D910_07157 [Dendroctonus ponderosae]
MVKPVVVFVIIVIIGSIHVQARSIDGLVRDNGIELPANEKISKRDTTAASENLQDASLPLEGPLLIQETELEQIDTIVKEREKRFLRDFGFPIGDVMGRL